MSYNGKKYTKSNDQRPTSDRGKRDPKPPKTTRPDGAKSSLLEREEEYKRLNAELEAKTAELVKEAEDIMTKQENFLRSSPHSQKSSGDDDFLRIYERESPKMREFGDDYSAKPKVGLLDLVNDDEYGVGEDVRSNTARVSARSTKSSTSTDRRVTSARAMKTRPKSGASVQKATRNSTSAKSNRRVVSAADDVAIPDDFMSKLTLDGAISNIERNLSDGVLPHEIDDDIMPAAATEMGSEAQIRFLKAKLRVMQEELERLSQECRSGNDERKKLSASLKDAQDEQQRLQKMNNTHQTQIEKHKRLLEEEKKKSESVGSQVQNLRREIESMKRDQKQSTVSHNATEVRLNRALEDVERYKSQLQKDKHSSKESSEQDRREMDRLRTENKKLERLKTDMSTVFKKQQKLISILKRQILHIEAAKLLSFTEEEFVKALDWGSK